MAESRRVWDTFEQLVSEIIGCLRVFLDLDCSDRPMAAFFDHVFVDKRWGAARFPGLSSDTEDENRAVSTGELITTDVST